MSQSSDEEPDIEGRVSRSQSERVARLSHSLSRLSASIAKSHGTKSRPSSKEQRLSRTTKDSQSETPYKEPSSTASSSSSPQEPVRTSQRGQKLQPASSRRGQEPQPEPSRRGQEPQSGPSRRGQEPRPGPPHRDSHHSSSPSSSSSNDEQQAPANRRPPARRRRRNPGENALREIYKYQKSTCQLFTFIITHDVLIMIETCSCNTKLLKGTSDSKTTICSACTGNYVFCNRCCGSYTKQCLISTSRCCRNLSR